MRLHYLLLAPLATSAVAVAADVPVKAKPQKGTQYAFLVAAARYEHLQPIPGEETVNDIVEFKTALLATGFRDEHIVLLHDRQADVKGGGKGNRYLPEHDKIVKELDLFLDGLTEGDTAVVVLSGHGVLFKGDKVGYFCPTDAKLNPRSKLLPMDGDGGIYTRLERCKAGRKLLIANTCRDAPSVALRDDLAGDKVELADDYPESVPKGVAALYSCQPGQKSYFDPKRGRSLFFIHLTDAWAAGGSLEDVFAATRTRTKADAGATKGEKQFPVVMRGYEGEWEITSTLAAFRQYTRVGFSDEQRRRLRGLLDDGKKKAADLKTDDDRVGAYADLAALAHFCGDRSEADAWFAKGVEAAKRLMKQEEYYGSAVESLVERLAWCGRLAEADAVVALDTSYSRHNKVRAVIKGLCLAGDYGEAWKRCGASDDRRDVEWARFDLLHIARELGDFDVVYAGAVQVVRDGRNAGGYGSDLAWLYRAERSLPLAYATELRKARGDDEFDRKVVGLIGEIGDARNRADGLSWSARYDPWTRPLVRELLPDAVRLSEKDESLSTYRTLLVTAIQVGDTATATHLEERFDALLKKQKSPKIESGDNESVVEAWARAGDLDRAKAWAARETTYPPYNYSDRVAVAYAAHLFAKGKVDDALDRLGTTKQMAGISLGELYQAALDAKATDRLWKWLRARPADGDDERSRRDLDLEYFAMAAVYLGDTPNAIAWLDGNPTPAFRNFTRAEFDHRLEQRAGIVNEGGKWVKANPPSGLYGTFFRNQTDEQIRKAKR